MGYTHYWDGEIGECIPDVAIDILIPILTNAYESKLIQLEYGSHLPPIICKEKIQFNGIGENGHETFYVVGGHTGFDFCKTARKPYDLYVCISLLVLNHYTNIRLSTDGDVENWMPAFNFLLSQKNEIPLEFYEALTEKSPEEYLTNLFERN